MNLPPNRATAIELGGDLFAEVVQLRQCPIPDKIPELNRSIGAVEFEPRLTAFSERVNVWRRVII